jgi:hypothetical protein
VAAAIRDWCRFMGTGTACVEPGSPWEKPYVESFNGKLGDELFAREVFDTVMKARILFDDWGDTHNRHRPPSASAISLRQRSPRLGQLLESRARNRNHQPSRAPSVVVSPSRIPHGGVDEEMGTQGVPTICPVVRKHRWTATSAIQRAACRRPGNRSTHGQLMGPPAVR